VEVLDCLLDLINLISVVILILGVFLSVSRNFFILEDIEEGAGVNCFDDGSGFTSFLMLLLLFDFLEGDVFAFFPVNLGTSDFFDGFFIFEFEGDRKSFVREEIIIFSE